MSTLNNFIEHTNLDPVITDLEIDKLIQEALEYQFIGVCIPPFWVKRASRDINQTQVLLCTPIGFPFGYQMTESKITEIELAIDNGADELEISMNLSAFKSKMPWVKIELAKCSKLIHESFLQMKVTIDFSFLSQDEMGEVCKICVDSGADFIKYSTSNSNQIVKEGHIKYIRSLLPSSVGLIDSTMLNNYSDAQKALENGADRLGITNGVKIINQIDEARAD